MVVVIGRLGASADTGRDTGADVGAGTAVTMVGFVVVVVVEAVLVVTVVLVDAVVVVVAVLVATGLNAAALGLVLKDSEEEANVMDPALLTLDRASDERFERW